MMRLGAGAVVFLGTILAAGQTKASQPVAQNASLPDALDAAQALIGRALFVRGFYVANDLAYDASARIIGVPKAEDWTLAGMDVKKVERMDSQTVELEGVRVAIRYNPDSHQFERHPLNDEKMKVLIADPGSAHGLEVAADAIFSQGIDPRLQRSTPAFWQHYFNPGLAWPQDALTDQQIYVLNGPPDQVKDVTPPVVSHKEDARMTNFAEKDRVHGVLQLRMVVDAEGVPRRIAVARPLGYGLDERAVEAVSKWRFAPATREGQPVAAAMLLNYDFEFAVPPHP
jgi:TonB family protein